METATRNGHTPLAIPCPAAPDLAVLDIPVFCILPPEPDDRDRAAPDYLLHEQRLADDIGVRGVRQPIYVMRLSGTSFRALTGWTRTLASRRAGKETIPAFVLDRPLNEAEQEMEKLLENEMRHDFTPLELARIYLRLMKLNGWSQAELAKNVHASPAQVAKVLAISTKLSAEVQALVTSGDLSPRAAYALTRLPEQQQAELARKAVSVPMAVESVEEAVNKLLGGKKVKAKPLKLRLDGVQMVASNATLEGLQAFGERLVAAVKRLVKEGDGIEFLPARIKAP